MSQHSGQPNQNLTVSEVFRVHGFKAVVTGGGSGIGLMITQALVANGADVFITGRSEDKLETVAKTYSGVGSDKAGSITPIVTDVTSKESIQQLVAQVSKACPDGIQLLVNNAGIARDDKTKLKEFNGDDSSADQLSSFFFGEGDPQAWADTLATNTTAHFFVSWAFVPLLAKGLSRPGAGSSIINITSISGLNKKSSGGQFAYATSKAAANHLTKMLAQQLLPTKIRVNAIAPGVYPSEMTAGKSGPDQKTDPSDLDADMAKSRPAGRPGGETDMGAAVLFLAAPGGNFVNGHVLVTDGGSLLTSPSIV